MTYAAFSAALLARQVFGVRPGLEAMRAVLAALGHPRIAASVIHLAGSNGKGSTAAMCEAILRGAGRKTLLYTSPHLHRFTERFRIAGQEVTREEVAAIGERVLAAGPELTYFEVATTIAWMLGAAHDVEVAILETGLGGRWDATNVVERPSVTVVTSLSLEHTAVLGSTIEAIATEKAGILKPGVPVVLGALEPRARAVVEARAKQIGAAILDGSTYASSLPERVALIGAHQRHNAALALAACAHLPTRFAVSAANGAASLGAVRWPGRLEEISPDLWIDAAHNAEGMRVLAAALPELVRGRAAAMVFGVVEDKDVDAMIAALPHEIAQVVVTRPRTPRALDPARLIEKFPSRISVTLEGDLIAAVERAKALAPVVIVAGSIFLMNAVRAAFVDEETDPVVTQDPAIRKI